MKTKAIMGMILIVGFVFAIVPTTNATMEFLCFGVGIDYTYNGIPFEVFGVDFFVDGNQTSYEYDLSGYKGTALHLLTFLYDSQLVPNIKVAEAKVYYEDGTFTTLDLVAGSNTAEWAWDRPGWSYAHSRVEPAYSWPEPDWDIWGDYYGHIYYADPIALNFKALDRLQLEWVVGHQYDPAEGTFTGAWVKAITHACMHERHETSIKGKTVIIEGNITITNIVVTKNTLHFNATGPTGRIGWINVTFPIVNTTDIKVFVNEVKLTPPPFPIITTNGTHYFIYFEFTLSTHTITIQFAPLAPTVPVGGLWVPINKFELLVPWITLASLITVVAVSVVYVKHRKKQQN